MSVSPIEIQANRLDLLSRLAGDLSHEIKNPLHAMVINLELVRRRVEKGDRESALERVSVVEGEIRKVHGLTAALLESLRPARVVTDESDFLAVVGEMVPLFTARARLARLDFAYETDDRSVTVALSAVELRQVVLNLLDLALACAAEQHELRLGVTADQTGGTLTIGYGGTALPEQDVAFLSGTADDDASAVLGLRVLRALVERAGGRFSARSEKSDHTLLLTLPAR